MSTRSTHRSASTSPTPNERADSARAPRNEKASLVESAFQRQSFDFSNEMFTIDASSLGWRLAKGIMIMKKSFGIRFVLAAMIALAVAVTGCGDDGNGGNGGTGGSGGGTAGPAAAAAARRHRRRGGGGTGGTGGDGAAAPAGRAATARRHRRQRRHGRRRYACLVRHGHPALFRGGTRTASPVPQ